MRNNLHYSTYLSIYKLIIILYLLFLDVLPILLAYTFAYVIVLVAVVMCSVELKSRHLLHSTYKLFLVSLVSQHLGVTLQSLGGIRYAYNGIGSPGLRVTGIFYVFFVVGFICKNLYIRFS